MRNGNYCWNCRIWLYADGTGKRCDCGDPPNATQEQETQAYHASTISARSIRRMDKKRKVILLDKIISILSKHIGERGTGESAIDALNRIIIERDSIRLAHNELMNRYNADAPARIDYE